MVGLGLSSAREALQKLTPTLLTSTTEQISVSVVYGDLLMELWENAFFQPFLETDHYLYLLTLSVRTDTICTLQRVKLLTKSLSVRDYTICTPQHNMYAEVC